MKKVIFPLAIAVLVLIASCHKNSAGPTITWYFESDNYSASACVGSPTAGTLTAASASPAGTLTLFLNPYPTSAGPTRYQVIAGTVPGSANEAGISLANSNGTYTSTGAIGSQVQQMVNVTVSGGKIQVTGADIELQNQTTASDSSSLTFNLNQTQ